MDYQIGTAPRKNTSINENGQFQLRERFHFNLGNLDVPMLNEEHFQKLQAVHDQMRISPMAAGFEYPWRGLEEQLDQGQTIAVAGYGSLMNRSSAARTFTAKAVESCHPVMVFGARRVYDYVMSPESRKRYGTTYPESHCGVLNAYVTPSARECFNAIQLELCRTDIERFREREFGYDLLPVITLDWNRLLNGVVSEPCVAYVLSCRKAVRAGRQMTQPNLHPHPLYQELCMDGAREVSSAFLEMFRRTTRISDRAETSPLIA